MSTAAEDPRFVVSDAAIPRLPHGFRLQFEKAQDSWVLLYPEGLIQLNGPAAEILKRVDGKTPVAQLIADLSAAFNGAELRADVEHFLKEASRHGWIV